MYSASVQVWKCMQNVLFDNAIALVRAYVREAICIYDLKMCNLKMTVLHKI